MIFTILQKQIKVTMANIFYLIYFVCLQLCKNPPPKLLSPQFKTFSFSILLQNVLDTGRKMSACGLKVALLKMLQTILKAGGAQVNIGKVEGKAVGADRVHGGDTTPPAAAAGGQDPAGGDRSRGGGKWQGINCVRGGRAMAKLGPLCRC